MSLTATLTADIRASATYFPPCGLCSFLNGQMPDQIVAPGCYKTKPTRLHPARWRIARCCRLSETDESFESEAAACAWWRAKRLQPDPREGSRQWLTLQRLISAGLEPIA